MRKDNETLDCYSEAIATVQEPFLIQTYEAHMNANNGLVTVSKLAELLEWNLNLGRSLVIAVATRLPAWTEPEVRKPTRYGRDHVLLLRRAAMVVDVAHC